MKYELSNRMNRVHASAIREIFKQTANSNIISFAGGNPSKDAFPIDEIEKISAEILKNDPISVLQYGITEGDKELIEQANRFFNKKYKVTKDNDQIMITSGSQQIMEYAAKCLCDQGDTVLIENPSFIGAINSFRSYDLNVVGIPFKNGQLDLEILEEELSREKKPKLIYLIPNFQNPTGISMNLETRKKVYDLAKKYEVVILEDDPYGDLRFEGEDLPSIKSMDGDGIVIYAGSLSKVIAPGMRVACCIGPKEIVSKFVIAKQVNDIHTNLWAQKVMAHFLRDYDIEQHLLKLKDIYKHKCELMLSMMKKTFHPDVSYITPSGGMFIWVTLPDEIDVQEFIKKALEKGVAVVPGNAFLDDEKKECHSFRMNFSTPSDENIVQGVQILGKLTYIMKDEGGK